jgi:hypothetical protein
MAMMETAPLSDEAFDFLTSGTGSSADEGSTQAWEPASSEGDLSSDPDIVATGSVVSDGLSDSCWWDSAPEPTEPPPDNRAERRGRGRQ